MTVFRGHRPARLVVGALVGLLAIAPAGPGALASSVAADAEAGAGLRQLTAGRQLHLGSAANAGVLGHDNTYGSVLGREFSMVTTEGEMRWAYTEPARGVRNFSAGEAVVSFAEQHHMEVRGHNLVWFAENPAWLEQSQFSRDELKAILRSHIKAVVGHFRGRVAQWDVVNEPLDSDGRLRDSVWLRGIGPRYLALAFKWAHQADPASRLFINEYGIEQPGPKLDGMVRLVSKLKRQGVPVGGVGFESHFGLGAPITAETGDELRRSMRSFRGLHVQTAVTELDVAVSSAPSEAELTLQAAVYRRVLAACLAVATCHTFVVWGFSDAYSWVPSCRPGKGAATLMDPSYVGKPAYAAVRDLLESVA